MPNKAVYITSYAGPGCYLISGTHLSDLFLNSQPRFGCGGMTTHEMGDSVSPGQEHVYLIIKSELYLFEQLNTAVFFYFRLVLFAIVGRQKVLKSDVFSNVFHDCVEKKHGDSDFRLATAVF